MMLALMLAAGMWVQDGPDLEGVLRRLASEDYETRAAARQELEEAGRRRPEAVRPVLAARLERERDPEVRLALQEVLRGLPLLTLRLELEAPAKVGRTVALKARIRNVSGVPQTAVRLAHMSDYAVRYPKFAAEVRREGAASPESLPELMGYSGTAPIRAADIVRLKPGEEFDPFEARRHERLQDWTPRVAGRYVVRLTVDYGCADPRHWSDPASPYDHPQEVARALGEVPAVKLEAKLEVVVEDR